MNKASKSSMGRWLDSVIHIKLDVHIDKQYHAQLSNNLIDRLHAQSTGRRFRQLSALLRPQLGKDLQHEQGK